MSNFDQEREKLRRDVELFHAYEQLKNNVAFRRLIVHGFCEQEVLNLNRQANRMVTPEEKLAKSLQAQAGPVLEAYLTRVENEGESAREKIPELDRLIAQQAEEEDQ
jgi:hypothetical protein